MCDVWINGKKMKRNSKKDIRKINYLENHLSLDKSQKYKVQENLINLNKIKCILAMDFKENFKIGGEPIETSKIFNNKPQFSV